MQGELDADWTRRDRREIMVYFGRPIGGCRRGCHHLVCTLVLLHLWARVTVWSCLTETVACLRPGARFHDIRSAVDGTGGVANYIRPAACPHDVGGGMEAPCRSRGCDRKARCVGSPACGGCLCGLCQLSEAARVPIDADSCDNSDGGLGSAACGGYTFPNGVYAFPSSFIYPLDSLDILFNLADRMAREKILPTELFVPSAGDVQRDVDSILAGRQ
jgi:hypothetical protein